MRNHNLEKMLNNFHNIPNLNKNSLLFLPKAESERVLFFSGTFLTWCSLAIICTYYMTFLYGGGGSRKPYVILMGGHDKCLLLMTRRGSKKPKNLLNT